MKELISRDKYNEKLLEVKNEYLKHCNIEHIFTKLKDYKFKDRVGLLKVINEDLQLSDVDKTIFVYYINELENLWNKVFEFNEWYKQSWDRSFISQNCGDLEKYFDDVSNYEDEDLSDYEIVEHYDGDFVVRYEVVNNYTCGEFWEFALREVNNE